MYQHILVPLDGSDSAEVALAYAKELAKRGGAEEVTVVRVIKSTKGYKRGTGYPLGEKPISQPAGKQEKKIEEYLTRIAKKLEDEGIKVQTRILLGKPAEAIVFYAEHNPCDVIVMATHGRAGLGRWLRGSVADKVLRNSITPVLMIRRPGGVPAA